MNITGLPNSIKMLMIISMLNNNKRIEIKFYNIIHKIMSICINISRKSITVLSFK